MKSDGPAATTPRIAAATALLVLAAACSARDGAPLVEPIGTNSEPTGTQVILDYSPTISDIGALFYLASHPDVNLLAVTLPERGESDCGPGVRHTRSLLMIAERTGVPVECGVEAPLFGDRDWPDAFREFANELDGVELPTVADQPTGAQTPGDGAQLLAGTLDAADRPVTIVAVGPLTNLGVVFRDRPDLADKVERVVIMGGAVDVPGNVEAAPTAEWNLHIDPEAARLVLSSGVNVLLVALDATNDVPWTDARIALLDLLDSPVARSEQQVIASRGFTEGVFLWDELAAVATLHPEMLTIERRMIIVDDEGATLESPTGTPVDVAVGADPSAAVNEFFRVINAGVLPDIPDATPAELAYFDAVEAGLTEFTERLDTMDVDPDGEARAEADRFLADIFAALGQLTSVIADADPPESIAADHESLRAALQALAAEEDPLREAVAAAEGDEFWALLERALTSTEFDQRRADVHTACASIADHLLLRAGSLSCGAFEN